MVTNANGGKKYSKKNNTIHMALGIIMALMNTNCRKTGAAGEPT
jgi:hypothetical protein